LKKIIIVFYCLIVCVCNVFAKNYIDYNIKILKAQTYLLDIKFDSALVVYKDAFNAVDKPFPKDIDNATLVAYYLDSIDLMKNYIQKSLERESCISELKINIATIIKMKLFGKK